jgi:hypothetical protein
MKGKSLLLTFGNLTVEEALRIALTTPLNSSTKGSQAKSKVGKIRVCLRCRKKFRSDGNRICSNCSYLNDRLCNIPTSGDGQRRVGRIKKND